MVMGADVTHPSRDSGEASFAAVVASVDTSLNANSWATESKIQKGGVEYIRDMGNYTQNFVRKFGKNMGQLPEQIIMLRDGVGEGQFLPVIQKELKDMKEACLRVQKNYKPLIAFLVSLFFGDTNLCNSKIKFDPSNLFYEYNFKCIFTYNFIHMVEFDFWEYNLDNISFTINFTRSGFMFKLTGSSLPFKMLCDPSENLAIRFQS
jgi:hypothetical protein